MALALAGALALPGGSAFAQTAPSTAPTYYKGKGPGGNNSYAYRFEENFAYLSDPSKGSDFFDPVKFIPFDESKQIYLSFSGRMRLRYEQSARPSFGLGTAAQQAKAHQQERYMRATFLGADLHIGPHFRAYGELVNGALSGRNLNGFMSATQRNDLALQQGFVEVMGTVDRAKIGLRAGRQGVYMGNGLIFALPGSANLWSPTDALRAYYDSGHDRVDVLYGRDVIRKNNDLLQDSENAHKEYWFVYGSHDFPSFKLFGLDARATLDPFYMHVRNPHAPAAPGGSLAAGTTFAGNNERHNFGLRLFGDVGNFDFDWTGNLQRGSIGGYDIQAFMVTTDWGYTFRSVPWKPRIGTHLDVASGGRDTKSKTTNLYDPAFFRPTYLMTTIPTGSVIGMSNLYDVSPRIRISPTSHFSAEFYWSFMWRYSSADAVMHHKGINVPSPFAGTVNVGGDYIGSSPDLSIRWTPIPHVSIDGEIGEFIAGTIIKNAGGQDSLYARATLTLQF